MPKTGPKLIPAFLLCLILHLFPGCEKQPAEPEEQKSILRLATTTSTADSGLLDVLIAVFESKYDIKVDVFAKGSSAALDAGRQGRADVVLTHERKIENVFITEGYGVNRKDVMYNDYVIVGPPDDPGEVKKTKDVLSALKQIYQKKEKFISRVLLAKALLKVLVADGVIRPTAQVTGPELLMAAEIYIEREERQKND